ncbi:hypothetical protein N7447_008108 [Penicillium robsamsonii]|uniref:uncharacterized protein n=1 Tax=Penicillium robsamsonii TaxID=1792511 RepID=UPI0025479707|nr:uncharacterized protein N7447_008108 [Penicillium robsamsonii]KAJ5815875.1 hypothetical protein N7447_008108 [Penicillium robsamsonii]
MWCFRLSNFVALIVLLVGPTATSGAVGGAALQASNDGLCSKYVVQAGETCSMIAQAQSITEADIETYNARSWGWLGCGHLLQGTSICISAGEPMMPAALSNAVCGPRVPGTGRPTNWSGLGSLNPCPANQCCSSFGYCGSGPDYCTSAAHTNGTNRTEGTTLKKTLTSTGAAKTIQKLVASSVSSSTKKTTSTSATKSVPKATSTTTTTKTTSTRKTTLATKSTKSSQTKTSTKTSESGYIKPWTMEMYSKKNCKGNYVKLQGHNVGYKKDYKCLRPNRSLSTESDTGFSCKWVYNNGASIAGCNVGGVDAPASWIVKGGICTVWEYIYCDKTSHRHEGYYNPGCQNRADHDIVEWYSMKCYIPEGLNES